MEVDMHLKKSPSPWLPPSLTAVAILVAVFKIFIDVRHWKQPSVDLMPLVVSILFTGLLILVLLIATGLNFRDMGREKAPEGRVRKIQKAGRRKCYDIE